MPWTSCPRGGTLTLAGQRTATHVILHVRDTGSGIPAEQLATMRAYLRQWIAAPAWQGEGVEALRQAVDGITSQTALDAWIAKAVAEGVDPL